MNTVFQALEHCDWDTPLQAQTRLHCHQLSLSSAYVAMCMVQADRC